MTNFEQFKNMNMNELARWIDENVMVECAPHNIWFDKKYCSKCDPIVIVHNDGYEMEYAYCEMNDKCRFFPEHNILSDTENVVKLWLENDYEENT